MLNLKIIIWFLVTLIIYLLYHCNQLKKKNKLKEVKKDFIPMYDFPFFMLIFQENEIIDGNKEVLEIHKEQNIFDYISKAFKLDKNWSKKYQDLFAYKKNHYESVEKYQIHLYHQDIFSYFIILPNIFNKTLQEERDFLRNQLNNITNTQYSNKLYKNTSEILHTNQGQYFRNPKNIQLLKSMQNIIYQLSKINQKRQTFYISLLQHMIKGGILFMYKHEESIELVSIDLFQILKDKINNYQTNNNLNKDLKMTKQHNNHYIFMPIAHIYYFIDNIFFIILICGNKLEEILWEVNKYHHKIIIHKVHSYYLNILKDILSHGLYEINILPMGEEYYNIVFHLPIK